MLQGRHCLAKIIRHGLAKGGVGALQILLGTQMAIIESLGVL